MWKFFPSSLFFILALSLFSGDLPAKEFVPSKIDFAQEIMQFEVLKRQWQDERDSQVKMIEEKERRLDDIKKALLSKIHKLKTEKATFKKKKYIDEKQRLKIAKEVRADLKLSFSEDRAEIQKKQTELEKLREELDREKRLFLRQGKDAKGAEEVQKSVEGREEKLQAKIRTLTDTIRRRDGSMLELREDLLSAKQELAETAGKRTEALRVGADRLRKERLQLRAEEDRIAKERRELALQKLEFTQTKTALIRKQAEMEEKNRTRISASLSAREQSQKEKIVKEKAELKRMLDNARTLQSTWRKKNEGLEFREHDLKAKNMKLKEAQETLNSTLTEHGASTDKARQRLFSLEAELKAKERAFAQQEAKLKTMQDEFEQVRSRGMMLGRKNSQRSEILEAELDVLKEQKAAFEQERILFNTKKNAWQAKQDEKQDLLKRKILTLRQEREALDVEGGSREAKLREVEKSLSTTNSELERVTTERTILKNKTTALLAELQAEKSQKKTDAAKAEILLESLQEKQQRLNVEIQKITSRKVTLTENLEEIREIKTRLLSEREILSTQKGALEEVHRVFSEDQAEKKLALEQTTLREKETLAKWEAQIIKQSRELAEQTQSLDERDSIFAVEREQIKSQLTEVKNRESALEQSQIDWENTHAQRIRALREEMETLRGQEALKVQEMYAENVAKRAKLDMQLELINEKKDSLAAARSDVDQKLLAVEAGKVDLETKQSSWEAKAEATKASLQQKFTAKSEELENQKLLIKDDLNTLEEKEDALSAIEKTLLGKVDELDARRVTFLKEKQVFEEERDNVFGAERERIEAQLTEIQIRQAALEQAQIDWENARMQKMSALQEEMETIRGQGALKVQEMYAENVAKKAKLNMQLDLIKENKDSLDAARSDVDQKLLVVEADKAELEIKMTAWEVKVEEMKASLQQKFTAKSEELENQKSSIDDELKTLKEKERSLNSIEKTLFAKANEMDDQEAAFLKEKRVFEERREQWRRKRGADFSEVEKILEEERRELESKKLLFEADRQQLDVSIAAKEDYAVQLQAAREAVSGEKLVLEAERQSLHQERVQLQDEFVTKAQELETELEQKTADKIILFTEQRDALQEKLAVIEERVTIVQKNRDDLQKRVVQLREQKDAFRDDSQQQKKVFEEDYNRMLQEIEQTKEAKQEFYNEMDARLEQKEMALEAKIQAFEQRREKALTGDMIEEKWRTELEQKLMAVEASEDLVAEKSYQINDQLKQFEYKRKTLLRDMQALKQEKKIWTQKKRTDLEEIQAQIRRLEDQEFKRQETDYVEWNLKSKEMQAQIRALEKEVQILRNQERMPFQFSSSEEPLRKRLAEKELELNTWKDRYQKLELEIKEIERMENLVVVSERDPDREARAVKDIREGLKKQQEKIKEDRQALARKGRELKAKLEERLAKARREIAEQRTAIEEEKQAWKETRGKPGRRENTGENAPEFDRKQLEVLEAREKALSRINKTLTLEIEALKSEVGVQKKSLEEALSEQKAQAEDAARFDKTVLTESLSKQRSQFEEVSRLAVEERELYKKRVSDLKESEAKFKKEVTLFQEEGRTKVALLDIRERKLNEEREAIDARGSELNRARAEVSASRKFLIQKKELLEVEAGKKETRFSEAREFLEKSAYGLDTRELDLEKKEALMRKHRQEIDHQLTQLEERQHDLEQQSARVDDHRKKNQEDVSIFVSLREKWEAERLQREGILEVQIEQLEILKARLEQERSQWAKEKENHQIALKHSLEELERNFSFLVARENEFKSLREQIQKEWTLLRHAESTFNLTKETFFQGSQEDEARLGSLQSQLRQKELEILEQGRILGLKMNELERREHEWRENVRAMNNFQDTGFVSGVSGTLT